MDIAKLKEVLLAFADDPAALILEKGRLVVQIQEELISADLSIKDGGVVVSEEGQVPMRAERWVKERIAQMDFLADRILQLFPTSHPFVTPAGDLLDQIEEAPEEKSKEMEDALDSAKTFLARRPAGTCSVLYLTSDAGEGKTTLIGRIAADQAKEYKGRRTDWLLVPINLGGSPILRLDNVIAAALLNQLRIRRFYFEGFMQLVRLGYLVPALDGFEEVFVETAGDAVSSLGNLIREMRGEGSLLIAARTAYFDFRRLDRQAKLLDAMPDAEVGFGRLGLRRWGATEFISYCTMKEIANPAQLHSQLSSMLGSSDHPLLTRAVFVRRIADLAKTHEGFTFLNNLNPELHNTFVPFIDRILEREIKEKWLDKQSEVATPLLTLEEHHALLRLLAEEMWVSKRATLTVDMCESLADIFCESEKKTPTISRQVRERLGSHALLVADNTGKSIGFDHDHFREFFLGEQIGSYLATSAKSDLRKTLRLDAVSPWTLDASANFAIHRQPDARILMKTLVDVSSSEGPSSYVRENAGALCIRLAQRLPPTERPVKISEVTLPPGALVARPLQRLIFDRCYFRETKIDTYMYEVGFDGCEFEHLEIVGDPKLELVTFSDCTIHGLTLERDGEFISFYDPAVIEAAVSKTGAKFIRENQVILPSAAVPEDDENVRMIRKLVGFFRRSTHVSESVIDLRMGIHSSKFHKTILPQMLMSGVLEEVPHRGGGYQRRFRLGRSMSSIANALNTSGGNYDELLKSIATSPRSED
jgi:hypothetical protein